MGRFFIIDDLETESQKFLWKKIEGVPTGLFMWKKSKKKSEGLTYGIEKDFESTNEWRWS